MQTEKSMISQNRADEDFQQDVRSLSLSFAPRGHPLMVSGWSQVCAMRALLPKYQHKISKDLLERVERAISEGDKKCSLDGSTVLAPNVRKVAKSVLGWPIYPGFPEWEEAIPNAEKILDACQELNHKPHLLKVVDGKLYAMLPELPKSILTISNNVERAHVTLVGSAEYDPDKHLALAGTEVCDVTYTDVKRTTDIYYPPFIDATVVTIKSETLRKIVGPTKTLHWTICNTLRQPYNF